HMLPKQLDADGMVSGRLVREGEVIGKVGNYYRFERATTYHLHFDLQVPTSQGWVFVNPYMTLVAAYERLIRGRGQEIRQGVPVEVPFASIPATANPATAVSAPPVPPTDLTSPASVAAKPTETAVESAPPKIESGTGRDAATDEPSSVTAGLPA